MSRRRRGSCARKCPGASITLSHKLGRIGLLERENVALLNACLQDLARRTVGRVSTARCSERPCRRRCISRRTTARSCGAETAIRFPVWCFASGPTNSMRGAAFLSGLDDGVVVDVGGTTTDIGYLKNGFPREANSAVEIGGVRTLFRMPDLLSIGLGGGTEISSDGSRHRPAQRRLSVAGKSYGVRRRHADGDRHSLCRRPDRSRRPLAVADLSPGLVVRTLDRMAEMIAEGIDRMKTEAGDVTLLAVGGGSFLIPDQVEGCRAVVRVEHHSVANALGAAIAQASGEVDQIFSGLTRDQAITAARGEAESRAVAAGATRESLKVVELEDIPLSYLPGDARRVRVRIVGDIGPD